jgi:ribulose-5-phosphate 4-epimerase/fuculose-1-phosphate aldolase
VAFNKEEQARLVRDLGPHYAMILDNHGLLTAGRSAGQCFWLMLTLERACEAQIAALAGGTALHMITPEAEEASLNAVDTVDFVRDWAAMLRLVKRTAPDYAN